MAEQTPTTREQVAKDQLAQDKEARQRIVDESSERMENSQPTPTQEENDLARMGVDVPNKEDDGSGPEIVPMMVARPMSSQTQAQQQSSGSQRKVEDKSADADKDKDKQAYATRQQTPKPPSAS